MSNQVKYQQYVSNRLYCERYFVGNAQLLKKLETVSTSLKDNAKIIVPANSELVNVIGEMAGAVIPVLKKNS